MNSLMTEPVLFRIYENIFTKEQIVELHNALQQYQWLYLSMNVLVVCVRILFTCSCIFLGIFFLSEPQLSFSKCFNIALKGEMVYVIYMLFRLMWWLIVGTPTSFESLQVLPLSLMSFFDPATIEPWLIYPLNTLNLFELFYVLLLSGLMAAAIKTTFKKAFEIVFVSYGAGLLLIMVVQMFLILNTQ